MLEAMSDAVSEGLNGTHRSHLIDHSDGSGPSGPAPPEIQMMSWTFVIDHIDGSH